ncbi:MAG: hypothetical protein ACR2PT_10310 [Endozoicomonas sp.]
MPHLSTGQKRKQKELRRKKRHSHSSKPVSKEPSEDEFLAQLSTLVEPRYQLSEVIWRLTATLVDTDNEPYEKVERTVALVVAAWNLALLPSHVRNVLREDTLRPLLTYCSSPEEQQEIESTVEQLIAIKLLRYPDDEHHIISFNLYSDALMYSLNLTTSIRTNE